MEEITIKLTDETVRRVNEALCEERRDCISMLVYGSDYGHDDEKTYWAKN